MAPAFRVCGLSIPSCKPNARLNGQVPRLTERVLGDDSTVTDLPWAAVFDPAANIRALGAVQSQGLRAATQIVDRFVKLAGNGSDGGDHDGEQAQSTSGSKVSGASAPNVDRVVASWESLMNRLANTVAPVAPVSNGAPTLDLNASGATASIHIETSSPGPVCAEVWLHNGGSTHHGEIALRCSDLLSHNGDVVKADAVHFEPDPVPMPARSSRGIVVTIELADDAAPGMYRGTVLVEGQPHMWLPLVLSLQSADR